MDFGRAFNRANRRVDRAGRILRHSRLSLFQVSTSRPQRRLHARNQHHPALSLDHRCRRHIYPLWRHIHFHQIEVQRYRYQPDRMVGYMVEMPRTYDIDDALELFKQIEAILIRTRKNWISKP